MPERFINFDCDGDTLVGIVHEPEGPASHVGVVIVVGGPQYRVGSHRQFVVMARRMARAGHAVLRFDYRGMGDSAGDLRTFESVDADVRAAVSALQGACRDLQSVVLFGLCDAASASVMYAPADPRVRGLILANPWVRTAAGQAQAYVQHYFANRLLQRSFWSKVFSRQLDWRGSWKGLLASVRLARQSPEGVQRDSTDTYLLRMQRGLASFAGPVLVLLSDRDLTAREFEGLCDRSPEWSQLLVRPQVERFDVPNADHTFSSAAAVDSASGRMIDWLGKFTSPE